MLSRPSYSATSPRPEIVASNCRCGISAGVRDSDGTYPLHSVNRRVEDRLRAFTRWQVSFDFVSIFAFVYFTGGTSSPFIFFFVFHVIFSSILLKHSTAHAFALVAALGMGLLSLAESMAWIPRWPLIGRELGWKPETSLSDGLAAQWQWAAGRVAAR